MDITSIDLAWRIWRGVVGGLALLAMLAGGFAMSRIDGVVVDDERPLPDKSPDEG